MTSLDDWPDDWVSPRAVGAVNAWTEAVEAGDFDDMWQVMDSTWRLANAQLWVWMNREHRALEGLDRDQLALELSAPESTHGFRAEFERGRVASYREALPDWWADRALATRERPVGTDLENVVYMPPEHVPEGGVVTEVDVVRSMVFVVRHVSGDPFVAGLDYHPPIPGWPPTPGGPVDVVDR